MQALSHENREWLNDPFVGALCLRPFAGRGRRRLPALGRWKRVECQGCGSGGRSGLAAALEELALVFSGVEMALRGSDEAVGSDGPKLEAGDANAVTGAARAAIGTGP